jgi:phospholipid/cholesterol/gamma-HCH transport system substrate-binding protein
METRANYALIGLFTLSVLTAAFLFVYWFSGGDTSSKQTPYRVVFTGSVSGLSRGSAVLFNGLRVGEVTSLRLLPNDPSKVVARVDIDSSTPVNTDTRARLEFQGLTGVASVQLSGGGGPDSKPLTSPEPGQPPIIYADRSDFQDLLESAQRLARKADDVLTGLGQVVAENKGPLNNTLKNVETFSNALAQNSEGVAKFLASTGNAADRIAELSVDLQKLTGSLDRIVQAVDPQDVRKIVTNVRELSDTLAGQRERFATLVDDAAKLASHLNDTAGKLDGVLADAGSILKGVDQKKVAAIVDNADRFAKALGDNSARVDEVVRNAQELTAKLNKAADKVEGVLASVQQFLGSDETKGALGDIGEMARSVRVLADNLDKRTAEITTGINRVTGPALREYESLAADGKRTLGELNRTLRSFEKNPQQLLFGAKPSIPEYSGR